MNKFLKILDWFIPKELRSESLETETKSRIFISILLICIWGVLCSKLTEILFNIPNPFPVGFVLVLFLIQIPIFTKFKNLFLSANILLFCLAISLGYTTYISGGMYSENLLFLALVPIIAFLLMGSSTGFAWLFLLIVFHAWLYKLELEYKSFFQEAIFEADYYYISLLFYFIILGLIIWCIAKIQTNTLNELTKQKSLLNEQKIKLESYANQLEASQKKILRSNSALEEFAYAASHDLKQPLRNITSFSKLLERNLKKRDVLDEASLEFLNFIQDGGKNMDSLITDLMNYSKISSSSGEKRIPVNLNDILEKVKFNLQVTIQENNVSIVVEELPKTIMGIDVKLLQLFQNLISNAIKFKRPNVKPWIVVKSQEFENHWRFSVTDNGIGVGNEYQKQIFNLFYKLHNKETFEGSGIGLSTCKAIVDQHDGKIWVESEKDYGSTFFFTISKTKKKDEYISDKTYTNPAQVN